MNELSAATTMTSVELVTLINKVRKEENPESATLRHDNFLVKIEKVLGDSSPKFLGVYKDQQDIERPCYNLPKRECHLMVMSESYKIQAAVYDRMSELESKKAVTPMSAGEILLAQAQALIALEKAQEEQQKRTAALEIKTKEVAERLDHIETATNHFTIMGWCRLQNRSVAVATAAAMGKQATKECKARKLEVGKTPDPRFGLVSTYPKFLLDELFLEE